MNNLLHEMIDNLTLNDIEVLNTLTKNEAYNRFSAIPKQKVSECTNVTESFLRKSIERLQAMNFIKVTTENRKQVLYVTQYGQEAIQNIGERGNINE